MTGHATGLLMYRRDAFERWILLHLPAASLWLVAVLAD
jgi:hypothetical protein